MYIFVDLDGVKVIMGIQFHNSSAIMKLTCIGEAGVGFRILARSYRFGIPFRVRGAGV